MSENIISLDKYIIKYIRSFLLPNKKKLLNNHIKMIIEFHFIFIIADTKDIKKILKNINSYKSYHYLKIINLKDDKIYKKFQRKEQEIICNKFMLDNYTKKNYHEIFNKLINYFILLF